LTYVIGWRTALETICAQGSAPRRVAQLKLAVALEEKLSLMSRVAPGHTVESRSAAEEADKLFDELGALIGAQDFVQIFDEAERLAARRAVALQ
jgi:hypothetical protein